MKVLKARQLDMERLEGHLRRYARTTGLLGQKPTESLSGYRVIHRPFRRVAIEIASPDTNEHREAQTLIDEELTPLVPDRDHRMLLWRPRYADTKTAELGKTDNVIGVNVGDAELQKVLDDTLDRRWACQSLDEQYQPKLKRLQADPLSVLSIVIPRRSGSLKREQTLIDERKEPHAYILASSLITNSSPRDILTSATLGERVFVETIVVCYEAAGNVKRILVLETPNAGSLDEATRAGKALTRLCALHVDCREKVAGTLKFRS